jgi:cell fate regulator YaaT (PSP1 superfamily)
MKIIIGVSFRQAGKVYYFDPGDEQIERGQHVIVETAKGVEYGTVVLPNREMAEEKIVAPLKKIIRVATPKDDEAEQKNREKEKDAFGICLEKIAKHGLEMKLIAAEYTFDRNKLLFYFTADGRIDFRELVKDLASVFRTRIELRQIGVRDETKICGGVGICGRALCCHTYLSEFAPVSIKMAKEQYEELNSNLPNIGSRVKTPEGLSGEVQSVSVLKQRVKVVVSLDDDEKEVRDYAVDELKFTANRQKAKGKDKHEKEAKRLEAMEKKEGKSKLNE